MAKGIYVALNNSCEVVYVGMSRNTATRWSKHRVPLRGGYHPNAALQRAWDENYGRELKFTLIEHCDASKLVERERLWINYFRPIANIDVLQTTAGQRTLLRNLTNNPTHRKKIILRNGMQFSSITAFARACGYAQPGGVTKALARGKTADQIAKERNLI